MTATVVLVALDGPENAHHAMPVAKRFADLRGGALAVSAENSGVAILAAAADHGAGLIVMSAHSADAPPAGAIGEAALAVLCGAHCPVVLVGPAQAPDDWALGKVLAPHDGSPTVSDGLRPATELARAAGAELIVLQVACDTRAQETGSIGSPLYLDQIQHGWPAWSREFLHRLSCICPLADVRVRLLVGHGAPANETVRVAKEEPADLIVLAWKGCWDAGRASTLKAVLRDAPCPVMVTRVLGS